MRRRLLVATVALAALAAGCLSVSAAEVPEEDLNANSWQEHSESRETVAMGMAEVVTTEYRPSNDAGVTGVIVATAPNVPIYDESNLLPRAIEQVEQKRNIDLTKTGQTDLSLSNLDVQTSADVYDFEKNGAQGQLVPFEAPGCDDFVVVAGYGITDPVGAIAEATYGEARDMATAVVC
jgi:hypothetical protein